MSWVLILALAVAAFVLGAFVLRLDRSGWALFGAALLFGLTGYALQGSPDLPAQPASVAPQNNDAGAQLVTARRQFFNADRMPSNWVVTGDAFARRGDYEQAAQFYRAAIENDSNDQEGWIALGLSLIQHADGNVTAAALYALEQAREISPANGAAQYFLGLARLQGGDMAGASDYWADALAQAPGNAEWREAVQLQYQMLQQTTGRQPPLR